MSKNKLKIELIDSINTNLMEIKGIVSDNKITYNDNNIMTTVIFDKNILYIERKSSEYILNLSFIKNKNTIGTCELYGLNKYDIEISTIDLIIDKESIYVKYKIDDDIKEYKVCIGGTYD